jgi:hypothetical protein
MMMRGHVSGLSTRRVNRMGEGKRKGHSRVKRMEVHNIYIHEDCVMKPTKH